MATVDKNFRIKNGLVVEGINPNQLIINFNQTFGKVIARTNLNRQTRSRQTSRVIYISDAILTKRITL